MQCAIFHMSSPHAMYMYMLGVYNTSGICNEESSLYVEWSKSSNGEVVTAYQLLLWEERTF